MATTSIPFKNKAIKIIIVFIILHFPIITFSYDKCYILMITPVGIGVDQIAIPMPHALGLYNKIDKCNLLAKNMFQLELKKYRELGRMDLYPLGSDESM